MAFLLYFQSMNTRPSYFTIALLRGLLLACFGLSMASFGVSEMSAQLGFTKNYQYSTSTFLENSSDSWKDPIHFDTYQYNEVSAEGTSRYQGPLNTFLTPAETYNPKRFWISVGAASAIYTGFAIGLWEAWYKDFETGRFRTFDDRGEWLNMDKFGHSYTAYHYTRWAYQGLNWSGTPRKRALFMAAGTSLLLQSTIEVMDGFSEKWGFSWSDMAMNSLGVGVFIGQDLLWNEQRINFKVSSFRRPYSDEPIPSVQADGPTSSLARRAEDLYGATPWQRFIKDYNGQTLWVSTNPAILVGKESKVPWLNVSFGYSPENVFGGFSNVWREGDFTYDASTIAPRYRQYVLSFDVDFERVPTKSPVLRTFLHLINHVKFPAPALSYGSESGFVGHWLYY
jgi:hypothetical protein